MVGKIILPVIVCLVKFTNAQQIEFAINLNSGLYYFVGSDAHKKTGIVLSPTPHSFVYHSPGKESGFSYEFSFRSQKITRKKWIYGIELAYQSLQSKTKVTSISPSLISSAVWMASGSTTLTSGFVGITHFAGYRIKTGKMIFDIITGLEYAPCIARKEKIDAVYTQSGQKVKDKYDTPEKSSDFRVRLQLTTAYKRIGINTGYFWGLKNYFDTGAIGHPEAYTRFFRVGVCFRI